MALISLRWVACILTSVNADNESNIEPLGHNVRVIPDGYPYNVPAHDCNWREPILVICEMSHEVIPMEISSGENKQYICCTPVLDIFSQVMKRGYSRAVGGQEGESCGKLQNCGGLLHSHHGSVRSALFYGHFAIA